ncbi:MAG: helix-turn-helix domain-containing protein [Flavobacteriales bacterium]|jgi:excisionase family DNA binding protein
MNKITFHEATLEELANVLLLKLKESKEDSQKPQNKTTSHEEYLTTVEVSQLFKISISTVHNWRKAGTLLACQIGGKVFFKRSDIDNAVVQLKS